MCLLVFICIIFINQVLATSNSIARDVAYKEQRSCVKACLWGYPVDGDLSIQLGCSSPWVNECYCRADAPPRASSILSKCVSTACTDIAEPTVDVANAISVYNAYCAEAMVTPGANEASPTDNGVIVTIESVATITGVSSGQTVIAAPTLSNAAPITSLLSSIQIASETITIHSTTTSLPSTGGGPVGGLSSSEKIALGVGIGIGLPVTLGTIVICVLALRGRLRLTTV